MQVTIQPGDYVAVLDITSEAVHAAVVKCFEAAGGRKDDEFANYLDSKRSDHDYLFF